MGLPLPFTFPHVLPLPLTSTHGPPIAPHIHKRPPIASHIHLWPPIVSHFHPRPTTSIIGPPIAIYFPIYAPIDPHMPIAIAHHTQNPLYKVIIIRLIITSMPHYERVRFAAQRSTKCNGSLTVAVSGAEPLMHYTILTFWPI